MQNNQVTLDVVRAHHRCLAILRTLMKSTGNSANLPLLLNWLKIIGLSASTDVIRGDLRKLAELGLVRLHDEHDMWPTELTQKGAEVAEGIVVVDGIQCPSPECPY